MRCHLQLWRKNYRVLLAGEAREEGESSSLLLWHLSPCPRRGRGRPGWAHLCPWPLVPCRWLLQTIPNYLLPTASAPDRKAWNTCLPLERCFSGTQGPCIRDHYWLKVHLSATCRHSSINHTAAIKPAITGSHQHPWSSPCGLGCVISNGRETGALPSVWRN